MLPFNFAIYERLLSIDKKCVSIPDLKDPGAVCDGLSCCFGAPRDCGHKGLTAICIQSEKCLFPEVFYLC